MPEAIQTSPLPEELAGPEVILNQVVAESDVMRLLGGEIARLRFSKAEELIISGYLGACVTHNRNCTTAICDISPYSRILVTLFRRYVTEAGDPE